MPGHITLENGLVTNKREYPRDEWIIGDGLPEHGVRREYVVHTKPPRFIARVVLDDEDGLPMGEEGAADVLSGSTYDSGLGFVLCEVAWIDPPPSEDIRNWLEAAAKAVVSSAED